ADRDFEKDVQKQSCELLGPGRSRVRALGRPPELEATSLLEIYEAVERALRAREFFRRDRQYVVRDGKVVIIDEFTGRAAEGRTWRDGLHQAVEAQEGIEITVPSGHAARITIQDLFARWPHLAGMTGTIATSARELARTYDVDVAVVPTNKPAIRERLPAVVCGDYPEKLHRIIADVAAMHALGRPVLIGTRSIDKSEDLSRLLEQAGLRHVVLNARHIDMEAEIVAEAGQLGKITVSTNMAGRGTDIKLGQGVQASKPSVVKDWEGKDQQVEECGGLHIIGSERHESRRIDRQLRGRAGRQGDPGASQFFLSLEDDLMRLFGSDRIAKLMDRMGAQEGEVLTHPLITRSIEQAQKRVELSNFQSRKRLLEYDDVMNQQREVIYSLRAFALDGGEELKGEARGMVDKAVARRVEALLADVGAEAEVDHALLGQELLQQYLVRVPGFEGDAVPTTREGVVAVAREAALEAFARKLADLDAVRDEQGHGFSERLLSFVMLGVIDEKWKDHLHDLDQLRNAIQYRSWGQKDPLLEYKQEAFTMFEDLLHDVHHTFTERFLRAQLVFEEPAPPPARRGPPPPPAGPTYNECGLLVPADDPGGAAGPPPKGDGRKKKGR
ncbi:MAG: preprotein translocase subunit SecA, partial [Gemmatimonadota bacterium]